MLSDYRQEFREQFIVGIREFADWLEAHPGVPAPDQAFNVYAYTKEDFLEWRRAAGISDKTADANFIIWRKMFGPIQFDINCNKEKTCRKVKTGERTLPAEPAKPERIEEVYEWVCDEPLLARDRELASTTGE